MHMEILIIINFQLFFLLHTSDSEHYYSVAMNNIAQRYGKEFTWATKVKIMGTTAKTYSKIVVEDLALPLTPEEYLALLDEEYPKVFPLVNMMPGVERLLEHLHKNKVPMAIASSSKKLSFEQKTQKFSPEWRNRFHHILLASDEPLVKKSKPAPDTFLICRDRFDPPLPDDQKCLVFEDSVSGSLAGCRAGMQVVMVPDPRLDVASYLAKEPELRPCQVIKSLEDFKPEDFGLPPFP